MQSLTHLNLRENLFEHIRHAELILEAIRDGPISLTLKWLDLSGWCFESRASKVLLAEIVAKMPNLDKIWLTDQ